MEQQQDKLRVLKVGYADCDPIFQDRSGNYSGYAVSYLEEIARYTHWEYEYIYDSWKNCLQRLENRELDLLVMPHQTLGRGKCPKRYPSSCVFWNLF